MTDSDCSDALISIRIVDIDYYTHSLDKHSPDLVFQAARLAIPDAQLLPKLPTVRIFGTTPAGQKACLHLHGIYPYFYVPLPPGVGPEDAVTTCRRLWTALDGALATSLSGSYPSGLAGQPPSEHGAGSSRARFIADIEPVLRTSMYGFTCGPRLFYRISLYNPRMIQRLAAIIRSGEGLPEEFSGLQPFESSMSFTLQVLTDFSLTGMGYINLSSCTFRLPVPQSFGEESSATSSGPIRSLPPHERFFTATALSQQPHLVSHSAPRLARSELELDAFADCVLNAKSPSQSLLPGQLSGPDAFAAKTLKVLWNEEQRRTGRKPFVLAEKQRAVVAGPTCSDPRLAVKLAALLEGESVEPHGADGDDADSLRDVVAFLDRSPPDEADKRDGEGGIEENASWRSSGDERDSLRDEEDWDDIHASTQFDAECLKRIPQGDGTGEQVEKGSKKRPKSRSRSGGGGPGTSRRRRVIGKYQPLSMGLGEDASNQSPHVEGAIAEKPARNKRVTEVGLAHAEDLSGRACEKFSCGAPQEAIGQAAKGRQAAKSGPAPSARTVEVPIENQVNVGGCIREHVRGATDGDVKEFRACEEYNVEAAEGDDRETENAAVFAMDDIDEILQVSGDERCASGEEGIRAMDPLREVDPIEEADPVQEVCRAEIFSSRDAALIPAQSMPDGVISSPSEPSHGQDVQRKPQPQSDHIGPVVSGPFEDEESFGVRDVLKPSRRPPSRQSVICSFGPGRGRPTEVHVPPFYGNEKDAGSKPIAVAGILKHIPVGGLRGLKPVESVFHAHGSPECVPPAYVLASVRRAPSQQLVVSDLKLRDDSDGLKRFIGTRGKKDGHIDAAGRYVAAADDSIGGGGSATPVTFISDPSVLLRPRVLRRRVETGAGNGDSSGESQVEAEVPSLSIGLEQTPSRTRPASPKYDERSFFPETPLRQGRASYLPSHPVQAKAISTGSTAQKEAVDSPLFKKGVLDSGGGPKGSGEQAYVSKKTLQCQNLSVAFVEIIASCHGDRMPDPRIDSVIAVCIIFRDERGSYRSERDEQVVLLDTSVLRSECPPFRAGAIIQYESEIDLFSGLAKILGKRDPDIFCGFETQTASVGFLLDRAEALELDFSRQISRVLDTRDGLAGGAAKHSGDGGGESAGARYFRRKGVDVKIPGRHVVNAWRVVRKEVKLGSYSLEGVTSEVLNRTLSKHAPGQLEKWLRSGVRSDRAILHLGDKTRTCMDIVDKLDILGRTGELARVYGIEFMSVLTRGSQYRVESMLARVGHPRGFVLLSAQRDQVFNQPAVECLPLVMEPLSDFYHDPVIVLDFQSLYPSMVIAHNLCFSTNLGNVNRLSSWSEGQQLGVVGDYRAPSAKKLQEEFGIDPADGIFVAPNGEMFVTASHRRGVLPQMLEEVLLTRVMVKNAMKQISPDDGESDEMFKRLNARQFAAKMLANVTYGFAAASATGRMPCAGLADAIVQCGRESLERIIRYVEDELSSETGVSVVYGDTDSLFVRVPGASKAEAFAIGRRIAAKAEAMFPTPVKLQLEKVYHPCMLVTKKRYVGYAYSSEDTASPMFDAKGIETVRRDSCPIVQKTMERALRTLFETRNVSRVKAYFQSMCNRIQRNGVPLSEFIFRKEVRLGSYKKVLPPAAVVATKAMERDPRAAPRYGERVAFVVIFGGPGATLSNSVVSPSEMLEREASGDARLHTTYYISKQLVPSLNRLFSLIGIDVGAWFAELPRAYFQPLSIVSTSRIPSYFPPVRPCLVCRGRSVGLTGVCDSCRYETYGIQASYYLISMRQRLLEAKRCGFNQACLSCVGRVERDLEEIKCVSLDCAVRFAKHRLGLRDMQRFLHASSTGEGWNVEVDDDVRHIVSS